MEAKDLSLAWCNPRDHGIDLAIDVQPCHGLHLSNVCTIDSRFEHKGLSMTARVRLAAQVE